MQRDSISVFASSIYADHLIASIMRRVAGYPSSGCSSRAGSFPFKCIDRRFRWAYGKVSSGWSRAAGKFYFRWNPCPCSASLRRQESSRPGCASWKVANLVSAFHAELQRREGRSNMVRSISLLGVLGLDGLNHPAWSSLTGVSLMTISNRSQGLGKDRSVLQLRVGHCKCRPLR
jgi:hypothetical protein